MRENISLLKTFEKRLPGYPGWVVGTVDKVMEAVHPGIRFPAASLIKIPILLSLLHEHEIGNANLRESVKLREKDKVGGSGILLELHAGIPLTLLDLATLMIVVSDNTATNLLIERLGIKAIQKYIAKIGLSGTSLAGKLLGTPEARNVNFTTPMDMFNLFQRLAHGDLLSAGNTRLALDILFRQQYNEKIPLFLPANARIAHKTGEISGVRHDCGIIMQDGMAWIGCFLTKSVKDVLQADRTIAEAARACHNFFLRKGPS